RVEGNRRTARAAAARAWFRHRPDRADRRARAEEPGRAGVRARRRALRPHRPGTPADRVLDARRPLGRARTAGREGRGQAGLNRLDVLYCWTYSVAMAA